MNYAIRLTYKWSEVADLFRNLSDDEAKAIVVYEHDDGNRPHIHAYVEELTITPQTMKNRLIRLLGFKPHKTDWSFKSDANRKFITYMSKGNLQASFVKNIDEAEIDGYRSQWIERRQPSPEMKAKSAATSFDMARELSEWIKQHIKKYDGYYEPPEDFWIVDQCITIHNKAQKTYTDFSLLRIIQTAWGMLDSPRVMKDKLIKNVCSRLYPQNNYYHG